MSALGPPSTEALLSVAEVAGRVHRMSVEDYHRAGEAGVIAEATELIRGVVIDKVSKSPLHVWLTEVLAAWLREGLGEGWSVREEKPVTLREADSEPEPDLAVVAGSFNDYRTEHPTSAALAIEIAVSSERLDREKGRIFSESGFQEFWLVLPSQKVVEVHRQPSRKGYASVTTLTVDDCLSPEAFPELQLEVSKLFSEA